MRSNAHLFSSYGSGHLSQVDRKNFVSSLARRVISWKFVPLLGVEQVGRL